MEQTTEQLHRQVLLTQLKSKHKTNHILHLLLSLVTMGLWVPVWILVAVSNGIERGKTERAATGNTYAYRLGKLFAKK